jgi:hypothetical protein
MVQIQSELQAGEHHWFRVWRYFKPILDDEKKDEFLKLKENGILQLAMYFSVN